MCIDPHGCVTIVTGAGSGIGRDVVLRPAVEGVTAVALDVNQQNLQTLGTELEASSAGSSQFVCDVTNLGRIQEVVGEVTRLCGRVDILLNNAEVTGAGPIETLSEEDSRRCYDVNATGTFPMCKVSQG